MSDNDNLDGMDEGLLDGGASGVEGVQEEGAVGDEPKRFSVHPNTLLLFGLMAAVGVGTYLMCQHAAVQAAPGSPDANKAATTIKSFLNGGNDNLRQMMNNLRETEKVVKQFNSLAQAAQVPLSALHTNPFLSADDQRPATVVVTNNTENNGLSLEDSIANGLKLESTICGTHSMCIINGRAYHEGQKTGTFTVLQIEPDGVVLQIGTSQRELKMAPPTLSN